MAFDTVSLIAQEEDGWGRMLYLLLFLVLPMLNKFGEKIRNWAAAKEEAKNAESPSPAKTPKGVARELQPAPRIVMKGELPAPPARRAKVPVARVPQAAAPRSPASPSRLPSPVQARRVRPKKTRAKSARSPAPDARAQRMAAARNLARETSIAIPPQGPVNPPAPLFGRLDPQSLRSVVVLSEILKPPLALREDWPEAS